MSLPTYITFKTELARDRSVHLCEKVVTVLAAMAKWCDLEKVPLMLTDTVSTAEEDAQLERVSDEHRTCRAVDISVRGWTKDQITRFMSVFRERYNHMGAISQKNGLPNLLVLHEGTALHIHVQVNRKYGYHWKESA